MDPLVHLINNLIQHKFFNCLYSFSEGDFIFDLKCFNSCKEFMSKATEQVPIGVHYSNSPSRVDLGSEVLRRLKKSYEKFLDLAVKISSQRWKRFYSIHICSKTFLWKLNFLTLWLLYLMIRSDFTGRLLPPSLFWIGSAK